MYADFYMFLSIGGFIFCMFGIPFFVIGIDKDSRWKGFWLAVVGGIFLLIVHFLPFPKL